MTAPSSNVEGELRGLSPDVVSHLVAGHARFLAFLQRRLGSREMAEDLLQEAFARALSRGESLRDGEASTAWFYRLLRNALVDHYRRRGTERRVLDGAADAADREPPAEYGALDEELMGTVCDCVHELLGTLKPEYADAIRQIDLEERSVGEYASSLGITSNNAGVRLHRARQALHKSLIRCCGTCATHGCLDCHCKSSESRC